MFVVKSFGVSFLNSSHSVTNRQQSASFMHSSAESAYFILFLKIVLATGIATGSYAVMLAPSFSS